MAHLLIVDDDDAFPRHAGRDAAGPGPRDGRRRQRQARPSRRLSRERFDAVFLDHRMPGMDGLQTLAALQARMARLPPVIVLTAFSSAGNTIEAMRLGAFDHLAKPISREAVREVLERALQRRTAASPSASNTGDDDDADLIGPSQAMREVHKRIGLAAANAMPVLVLGETGTGKEMVARALHRYSARAERPFVAVNCSAIPKELLESELFGHVRGAFTGATGERPGCFRAADGGVLLLDEIGDMALDVQAKILRALQEGEVTPLGSHKTVKVDVRVVAATAPRPGRRRARGTLPGRPAVPARRAVDPHAAAARAAGGHHSAGGALPAPRRLAGCARCRAQGAVGRGARAAAEPPVAGQRAGAAQRDGALPCAGAAPRDRRRGPGPRARCRGSRRSPATLPADWLEGELPAAVEKLERLLIAHALAQTQGNRAETARRLGIHRQLLYRKLAQYGLE